VGGGKRKRVSMVEEMGSNYPRGKRQVGEVREGRGGYGRGSIGERGVETTRGVGTLRREGKLGRCMVNKERREAKEERQERVLVGG